jgi:hypothetical protein
MRQLMLAAIALLVFSIPGRAQEYSYPKAEIFGGFSISSMGFSSTDPLTGLTTSVRNNMWGWQASVAGNFQRHFGFVGDFGGQYKSVAGVGMSNYQYLFGPQISMRKEKVTPFVHALFGASRTSILGISATGFGMGIGGGLDVNVSHRLALRVPQFDWTPVENGGVWANNAIRVGIGLVIKAGE